MQVHLPFLIGPMQSHPNLEKWMRSKSGNLRVVAHPQGIDAILARDGAGPRLVLVDLQENPTQGILVSENVFSKIATFYDVEVCEDASTAKLIDVAAHLPFGTALLGTLTFPKTHDYSREADHIKSMLVDGIHPDQVQHLRFLPWWMPSGEGKVDKLFEKISFLAPRALDMPPIASFNGDFKFFDIDGIRHNLRIKANHSFRGLTMRAACAPNSKQDLGIEIDGFLIFDADRYVCNRNMTSPPAFMIK